MDRTPLQNIKKNQFSFFILRNVDDKGKMLIYTIFLFFTSGSSSTETQKSGLLIYGQRKKEIKFRKNERRFKTLNRKFIDIYILT